MRPSMVEDDRLGLAPILVDEISVPSLVVMVLMFFLALLVWGEEFLWG